MPEQNEAQQAGENQQQQGQQQANETFDGWLEKQDDNVKALYQSHTTGLRNAVAATRNERDDFARQVKELSKKAEKGSEIEKELTGLSTKLEAAERRADFMEQAIKPEIGCRNPKAAYALAVADGLFTTRGDPDWTNIKSIAPELFGMAIASGNAGAGTQSAPPREDMNTLIRRKAGRL